MAHQQTSSVPPLFFVKHLFVEQYFAITGFEQVVVHLFVAHLLPTWHTDFGRRMSQIRFFMKVRFLCNVFYAFDIKKQARREPVYLMRGLFVIRTRVP